MKVWKIAIVITLALGLTMGVALPGLAAPDATTPPEDEAMPKTLRGSVVGIDDNQEFFVIQSGEKELTITVDDNTKYFKLTMPRRAVASAQYRIGPRQLGDQEGAGTGEGPRLTRAQNQGLTQNRLTLGEGKGLLKNQLGNLMQLRRFGEEAAFNDITVGARVAVRVVPGEDKPVAKLVFIMKPAAYKRIIGTITDISTADKTITIAPADGSSDIILNYNEETRFILRGITKLEEGQSVRAIYDAEMLARAVFAPIEAPEPAE